jgi:predicted phosphodiesterase
MRIAAISDVHGNVFALDAVLAHLRGRDVDVLTNLGDHLSGAVDPAATAARLMRTPAVSVRGNHDRQALDDDPLSMRNSDRLVHDTITTDQRAWLAALPLHAEIGAGVLAFHATPDDDLTYLLETVTVDGARPATEAEVLQRLGGWSTRYGLLLCGHTHLQRSMRLSTGTFVVNPGSVGWPAFADDTPHPHVIEAGSPHARYAIVDDASGRWEVEFFAVDYPWDDAARAARSVGRDDVARALETGYALG